MKPEIRVLDASTLKDKQASRTEIGICAPDSHVNATAVVVGRQKFEKIQKLLIY